MTYTSPRNDPPAPDHGRLAEDVAAGDVFGAALEHLTRTDEPTLTEQIELREIPAPPCGEGARASRMAGLMRESGLEGVETDAVGNVLGWLDASAVRPGEDRNHGPVVVSAHLDTVFPPETDV